MLVVFDRSFNKALNKIKDSDVLHKIESSIILCEEEKSIRSIKGIKKLSGFKNYYRIKIGDYRISVEHERPKTIRFITVLHRKNIYNKFP